MTGGDGAGDVAGDIAADVDPIVVGLVANRLYSLLEEQQAALVSTAFSPVVRECLDLACGVFDSAGRMIGQSTGGTPGHINAMATGMQHVVAAYRPEALADGDVLITNDPWMTAGQINDLTVATPVFRGGRLVAWFANCCHSPDIGGRILSAAATEVYEEGLRLPILKLLHAGRPDDVLERIVRSNVRTPDETMGDIYAQVAGNQVGVRSLLRLLDEFGLADVDAVAAQIMDRSEAALRAAIALMPDGRHTAAMATDGFGDDPLELRVAVTIEGDGIAVDYAGSSPQSLHGINVVLNYTRAYTSFAVKAALAPEVPHNAGSFRPVTVTAPAGSVLHCVDPAPVASRHLVGHFLPSLLFEALRPAVDGGLPAASADALWMTVWRGGGPGEPEPFTLTVFGAGGTGARPDKDGLTTTGFPTGVRAAPTEVLETLTPLVQRAPRDPSGLRWRRPVARRPRSGRGDAQAGRARVDRQREHRPGAARGARDVGGPARGARLLRRRPYRRRPAAQAAGAPRPRRRGPAELPRWRRPGAPDGPPGRVGALRRRERLRHPRRRTDGVRGGHRVRGTPGRAGAPAMVLSGGPRTHSDAARVRRLRDMTLSEELAYATAADLAALVRRRELSPVELVDAVVERIEARNPSLNALVFCAFDEARDRAAQAERDLTSGGPLGPLHGVPTATKDLFDFKPGWPATMGGVRAFKDLSVPAYCTYAERMEAAGAILVGKTNSPVMGFRGTCDNYLFGPTRNPFDLTKNSGGSSGGSAAAVADGLLPLAEGTDGGGSIRIPAAWCGVYGYKPSFGRVPSIARPNAFASLNPFLFEGPITRTVEDAALALDVLAGYDDRDPFALDDPASFAGSVRRPISGWRIAYSPDFGVHAVDRRVAAAVERAVGAFEQAGAVVEQVDIDIPFDQRELSDLWCRLIIPLNIEGLAGLAAQGFDVLGEHREDLPPEYLRWIDEGYRLTALDVARDQQKRTAVHDGIQRVLRTHDLLVTPTVGVPPVDNADDGNTLGPSSVDGIDVDPLIGWCLTYLVNFSGHPAASVPAGDVDGLPVGMQLIGRRYADSDVLAASAAYERIRPWRDAYTRCRQRPLS